MDNSDAPALEEDDNEKDNNTRDDNDEDNVDNNNNNEDDDIDEDEDEDDDEDDDDEVDEDGKKKKKKRRLPPSAMLIQKAKAIHGANPRNLIEKIVRIKIQSHPYWKEKCIGLNEETLVDRAMALNSFGGTYGGSKQPTNFLCLILKMLQIQPDMDIIAEFITNEDFKYVTVLGAFYLRLIGKPLEIYKYLEPLYNDYRSVRMKLDVGYRKLTIDQFVEELLTTNYACDIALPHLPHRQLLEQQHALPKRVSALVDLGIVDMDQLKLDVESELDEQDRASKPSAVVPKKTSSKEVDITMKDSKPAGSIEEREPGEMDRDVRSNDHRGRDRDQHERGHHDRDHRDRDHRDRDDRYRSRDYRDDRDYRDRDRYRDRDYRDDRDRDRGRDRDRDRYDDRDRRDRDRDSRDNRDNRDNRDRYDDRDHKDRDGNRDNRDSRDGDRDSRKRDRSPVLGEEKIKKKKDVSKYEKGSSSTGSSASTKSNGAEKKDEQTEIEEMNALRAKLGLKPLKS
ncbi:hypothetical protein SAMD00019534_079790 [Acytostelium subglobosum LB1]|uniref:hypothetical protein n=1 Tax=Acytostelium subglobosum LB1 TaxID=1410327 RepID=UPI000644932D|nr:hypothetical protein SAMD00019534_079790 [Acytostelium subglobosum LB1]GAM24804.1 hypothetical protein SAMD00019534_079790 [Acytostelium subglobosum LB1]|eukprot:XP_012752473.1 hypothetical protein SAMD00019534_079790 [Acytostelium subglobosum LB1]